MKQIIFISVLCTICWFNTSAQKGQISIEQPVPVGSDTVYGSLLTSYPVHSKQAGKQPLVVIIPGSGPTDRDGNSSLLPGPNNAYRQLADSLLEEGISSFRYDKPGVGRSGTLKTESEMRFEDNVEVVKQIVRVLRKQGFRNIYLAGHSEGSLIGMLAAQELEVEGFISLNGPGVSYYQSLKDQLEANLPVDMFQLTMRKLDSIKSGFEVSTYPPMLSSLLRESVQPYLRSAFQYLPAEELAELNIPVLIIQGGYDIQVKEADALALKEASKTAGYKYYPKMNHVLKITDGSQEQNYGSYSDPDFPLYPGLVEDIASWIRESD